MAWSTPKDIRANSPIAQLPSSPEDLSSPNSLIGQLGLLGHKKNTKKPLGNLSIEQADIVMNSITDLVPVDSAYRPKYYAALYRMGAQLFMELADRARKGKAPQHLFRVLVDGKRR